MRRRHDPIGRTTSAAITSLYLISYDRLALMGHGRSPYRNAEFSSSVRAAYWRSIGGSGTCHSLRRRRPISGCNACPFRSVPPELQCLSFPLETHSLGAWERFINQGVPFLGGRAFPTHRLLAPENIRRFGRHLRSRQRAFAAGRIGSDAIHSRITSWTGNGCHADTYRLRTDLFRRITFQRAAAKPLSASGRDAQQSTGEGPLGELKHR